MTAPIAFEDKRHVLMQDLPASSRKHEYVALPAKGWTRILKLHFGPGSLACSLRGERTEDVAMGFEALFYVWGHDALQNTVDIECNEYYP